MKEDKSKRREAGRSSRERWILLGFCYEETNRESCEGRFYIFYYLFFFRRVTHILAHVFREIYFLIFNKKMPHH